MKTYRPDDDELEAALDAAERMRAEGKDPHHLAKVLRYLHDRNIALQALLVATDKYLRFGMPEHEISQMRLLVNRLRESELAADDSNNIDSTLPI
ncbi:MAG: hypothetical protein WBM84_05080 [Sedimenticolaceae bacterium]